MSVTYGNLRCPQRYPQHERDDKSRIVVSGLHRQDTARSRCAGAAVTAFVGTNVVHMLHGHHALIFVDQLMTMQYDFSDEVDRLISDSPCTSNGIMPVPCLIILHQDIGASS